MSEYKTYYEEKAEKAKKEPLSDSRYAEAMKLIIDPFVRFHGEEITIS